MNDAWYLYLIGDQTVMNLWLSDELHIESTTGRR
jgi:hypothetical protein